jgi:hypothetical protein
MTPLAGSLVGTARSAGIRLSGALPHVPADLVMLLVVGVPAWIITLLTIQLWLKMRAKQRARPHGAVRGTVRIGSHGDPPSGAP